MGISRMATDMVLTMVIITTALDIILFLIYNMHPLCTRKIWVNRTRKMLALHECMDSVTCLQRHKKRVFCLLTLAMFRWVRTQTGTQLGIQPDS
jgi:hypothetical protein